MRPNPRNEKDETPAEKSAREQREAEQKRLAAEKVEATQRSQDAARTKE